MRTTYHELSPAAPQPRLWKSLGHVMMGVEMHYALDVFSGDLDPDREAELRSELAVVAQTLTRNGHNVVGYMLAKEELVGGVWPGTRITVPRICRFVSCDCADRGTETAN